MTTNATPPVPTSSTIDLFTPDGELEELVDVSDLVEAGYGDRSTLGRVIRSLGLGIQLTSKGRLKIRKRDVPLIVIQPTDSAAI